LKKVIPPVAEKEKEIDSPPNSNNGEGRKGGGKVVSFLDRKKDR
jgi:hypothetical protein